MLSGFVTSANAQLSIGIGLPGVSIGINVPSYPTLVQVPNYPVYYAPGMSTNYFFYDGMYWVYQSDNWYTSEWYNGPWGMVGPEFVPLYVLRVPVRYYRSPPPYFRGWQADAPPRWGDHWGNQWQQQHSGWDRWNRGSAPAPAPLPAYQKGYSGGHYPKAEQQPALRSQNYRYQPHEAVARQQYQDHATPRTTAPPQQGSNESADRNARQPDVHRPSTPIPAQRQSVPVEGNARATQRAGEDVPRPSSSQQHSQPSAQPAAQGQRGQPHQETAAPEQRVTEPPSRGAQPQGKGQPPDSGRGQEQDKERGQGGEKGQGRN